MANLGTTTKSGTTMKGRVIGSTTKKGSGNVIGSGTKQNPYTIGSGGMKQMPSGRKVSGGGSLQELARKRLRNG